MRYPDWHMEVANSNKYVKPYNGLRSFTVFEVLPDGTETVLYDGQSIDAASKAIGVDLKLFF